MAQGGFKIRDQEEIHFITFSVVEWMNVFCNSGYQDIVVNSLNYCVDKKGLNVHAWVIMSNHLHLILSVKQGFELSAVLRDFKKFTSVKLLEAIRANENEGRKRWLFEVFLRSGDKNSRNVKYQVWQQDNHPIELSYNSIKDQTLRYVHQNPVKARIVRDAEDYIYSSAIDYAGGKGLVKISYL